MITEIERKYILNSMINLLDEYDYNYTLHALNSIIDEWASQKDTLIEAFKKHPNYVDGKFLIAFDSDYTRDIDVGAIQYFESWLCGKCVIPMTNEIPEDVIAQRDAEHRPYVSHDLADVICSIHNLNSRNISEEFDKMLEKALPQIHPRAGQKTSKVINKMCTYLNYSKHPDYNKEFAKFADALSPLTIRRHTVLSINPLDYLTMSFGNSWASCHTIDKNNKRDMPNSYSGQYSSGTMSYMLDSSSMVFYTVDAEYDGTDYWTQSKINRQMFHYGEDKLVQGRLYPQANDDNDKAYEPYRKIVQSIMSTIFDFPNFWTLQRGTSAAEKFIDSEGTHYRDYENYSNCTLSKIKGVANDKSFTVGARPICIHCGERHNEENNINHCADKVRCAHCGKVIREEDSYAIDGQYYCDDCVCRCPDCGCFEIKDKMIYLEEYGWYVCNDCLENGYKKCAHCGEYTRNYGTKWCEELGDYVCESCYNEHYAKDDEKEVLKQPLKGQFFKTVNIDTGAVYRSMYEYASRWFVPWGSADEEDI
jgi:hypothetical protein